MITVYSTLLKHGTFTQRELCLIAQEVVEIAEIEGIKIVKMVQKEGNRFFTANAYPDSFAPRIIEAIGIAKAKEQQRQELAVMKQQPQKPKLPKGIKPKTEKKERKRIVKTRNH